MPTGDLAYEETDFVDTEIALGVLDAIDRNPSVTQRSVAEELGIALGLANAYLKRCVRKGLIKVNEVPARRYAYYLTPQGFAEKSRLTASYLSHSFSFFRRARSQCAEIFDAAALRGQKRFVLLGSGDLADIALLVAREKNVDVAGIASANNAADLQRQLKAFGQVDAVMITALERTNDALKISLAALLENRVHIPELLRVRFSRPFGASETTV
ncbi:MAG: winged helix-turn-helix transcriptional regulator [Afipia sp.]|nr:winged helix-turn-helix transcriptional regulator [Afipia sp.]